MVNLEKLLVDISNHNPDFVLITGDYNAKSRNWSTNDTVTAEGAPLDCFMTLHDLNQLIKESTNILKHSSSCIDLIFTN